MEIPGKTAGIVEQKAMRKRLLFSLLANLFFGLAGRTQAPPAVRNASGMRLVVADENSYPTLRVVLPGHPDSDKTIEVIFPEHVHGPTCGRHGRKASVSVSARPARRSTCLAAGRPVG